MTNENNENNGNDGNNPEDNANKKRKLVAVDIRKPVLKIKKIVLEHSQEEKRMDIDNAGQSSTEGENETSNTGERATQPPIPSASQQSEPSTSGTGRQNNMTEEQKAEDRRLRSSLMVDLANVHITLIEYMFKERNIEFKDEVYQEAMLDIPFGVSVNTLMHSLFMVCRQRMNTGVMPPLWNKMGATTTIPYKGTLYEVSNRIAYVNYISAWASFGRLFKKVNGQSPRWISIVSPYYSYLSAFGYRIREMRVGRQKFGVKRENDPNAKTIDYFGLQARHQILCSGISTPPERASGMIQSLGPLTILVNLNKSGDRFSEKWKVAAERAIGHLPDGKAIVNCIAASKTDNDLRALMAAVGDLLLLTSARSFNRVSPPPNMFAYLMAHHKQELADKMSFNGPGATLFYKMMALYQPTFGGKDISEGLARQIVYHAYYDSMAEDLSIIEAITTERNMFKRKDFETCFKEFHGANSIKINLIQQVYFSRLVSANQSEFFRGANQQLSCVSYMNAKRRQQVNPDLFKAIQSNVEVGGFSDIRTVIRTVREHTNRVMKDIEAKGNIVYMGTADWRRADDLSLDNTEASVVNLNLVGTGKFFWNNERARE